MIRCSRLGWVQLRHEPAANWAYSSSGPLWFRVLGEDHHPELNVYLYVYIYMWSVGGFRVYLGLTYVSMEGINVHEKGAYDDDKASDLPPTTVQHGDRTAQV